MTLLATVPPSDCSFLHRLQVIGRGPVRDHVPVRDAPYGIELGREHPDLETGISLRCRSDQFIVGEHTCPADGIDADERDPGHLPLRITPEAHTDARRSSGKRSSHSSRTRRGSSSSSQTSISRARLSTAVWSATVPSDSTAR